MVDIVHRIAVSGSSPEEVYTALTSRDRLAAWWTEDTEGDGDLGGLLKFRFLEGGLDMRVEEALPGKSVIWKVVDGPAEWIGTRVGWELTQDGDWTVVLFRHEGWREQVEFMHHCSTKWAVYLMSLKSLVETGAGAPAPHDVRISNWH